MGGGIFSMRIIAEVGDPWRRNVGFCVPRFKHLCEGKLRNFAEGLPVFVTCVQQAQSRLSLREIAS
ncbi:MAG: hypothetical protein ACI9HK_002523 [Pirellulaceae bacterium]